MVQRLAALVGRREAIALAGRVVAALSVSELDEDEITRIARSVATPCRVDAATVAHLQTTLRAYQAQEDELGPQRVVETVTAQLRLVRGLLAGGVPDPYHAPLWECAARIAAVLGGYFVDLADLERARIYYRYGRRAAHVAQSPACGAYAAGGLTFTHYLSGDVISALDCAQAALGLSAQTPDMRVKAFCAQMAAAASSANGQHRACMQSSDTARALLARADAGFQLPWYWLSGGIFDSQLIAFLLRLGRPKDALQAVELALDGIESSFVGLRAFCRVRRACAMVAAAGEIDPAAGELAEVVSVAHLAPRLAADLLAARNGLDRWRERDSVRELDARLAASGLWVPPSARRS